MIGVAARPVALAWDAEVPQRDEMLDADLMGGRLAALFGLGAASSARGARVRAKYRVGEGLRVVHRVVVDGESTLFSGRTFDPDRLGDVFGRACSRVSAPGAVAVDEQLSAVWWRFPADRRLVGIDQLTAPQGSLSAFEPGWVRSEVAEYAPERSLTVRALGPDRSPIAYVKLYASSTDVAALVARARCLSDAFAREPYQLARVRWCDETRSLIASDVVPGTMWSAAIGVSPNVALNRFGAAVATLHHLGLPALTERRVAPPLVFARFQARRIETSARVVGLARPDLADSAFRLADELRSRIPAANEPVLLHGDCHLKNALFDADRIALIDLDQAGIGDPAADLGSLIARVRVGARRGEFGVATPTALERAVVDGYRSVRPLPSPESLRWYTSASMLVERAVRAINRVHDRQLDAIGEALDEARSLLDERTPR